MNRNSDAQGDAYKHAGVDIDVGDQVVKMIAQTIKKTWGPEVIGGFGGFSGLFDLPQDYTHPVLVAGTDGVGTKLKVAQMMGIHDTVGIDLVAMCVNDIVVSGAEPLFFLDYLAVGKLDAEQAASIITGVAEGCSRAGCALIGGETAEMPGFYGPGEYDLAGFAVGVVERLQIIDGSRICAGDCIIGLPSSGIHSNGLSLARKVLFEDGGFGIDEILPQMTMALGEELLVPTCIYSDAVKAATSAVSIKGMAHITGGGMTDNIPRILPDGLAAEIKTGMWVIPELFTLIQSMGNVTEAEMFRTFNMGIGMVMIADTRDAPALIAVLEQSGIEAVLIGSIIEGKRRTAYA